MKKRKPFNPWENHQDQLIDEFNKICGNADHIIVSSDALSIDGLASILQEIIQADSRLQCPPILLSGIGIMNLTKASSVKAELTSILQSLRKHGTAADGRIRVLVSDNTEHNTEESELRAYVFAHHRKLKQVVISRNIEFLRELRQLCKADTAAKQTLPLLVTLSLSESGQLVNPFDTGFTTEAERIASDKLEKQTKNTSVFIDTSALNHPMAPACLQHLKAAMRKTGAQLAVLAYKDRPLPHSEALLHAANENPPIIRFAYLNSNLPTSDAIVDVFLQASSITENLTITYITDKVNIGERIVTQLNQSGIKLYVYTINRLGYLSNIDRTIRAQARTRKLPATLMERQMTAVIQENNVAKMMKFACGDRLGIDAIQQGIIAALRYNKDEYLTKLIDLADNCPPTALTWWILNYPGFRNPLYLEQNVLHFELIKKLICKTNHRYSKQLTLDHLKELNEVPSASHKQLEELIALMEAEPSNQPKKRNNTSKTSACESIEEVALRYLSLFSLTSTLLTKQDRFKFIISIIFLKRIYDCLQESPTSFPCSNNSGITFGQICQDAEQTLSLLKTYIDGFSENIREILDFCNLNLDIYKNEFFGSSFIKKVAEVISTQDGDFSTARFSNESFFELMQHLIRQTIESNRGSEHLYSNPDLSALTADLLITGEKYSQKSEDIIRICDMAIGSASMLNAIASKINNTSQANVEVYGQDIATEAIGYAKILAFLSGQDTNRFICSDAFTDDAFPDKTFRYIVGEPPILQKINRARLRVFENLPPTDDSTMFFLLAGLNKLDTQGKMAIIQPGRSLFSRTEDKVRRYLIENDLLEAIVELPTRMYISTSIPLYIWIVNKNKDVTRKGKVLLLDASHCGGEMRKTRIARRRELNADGRSLILQAFTAFENNGIYGDIKGLHCMSRVIANTHLGHREISISMPKESQTVGSTVFSMPRNELPEVFFAREVLPAYPEAKLELRNTRDFFDIQMNRYFYTIPEGETLEGSLTHKITVLSKRITELKDELEARTRFYREQIETEQEKLYSLLSIAEQIPGIEIALRGITIPR